MGWNTIMTIINSADTLLGLCFVVWASRYWWRNRDRGS